MYHHKIPSNVWKFCVGWDYEVPITKYYSSAGKAYKAMLGSLNSESRTLLGIHADYAYVANIELEE